MSELSASQVILTLACSTRSVDLNEVTFDTTPCRHDEWEQHDLSMSDDLGI